MRYCVVAEQQADSWVELGEATGVRDASESRLAGDKSAPGSLRASVIAELDFAKRWPDVIGVSFLILCPVSSLRWHSD